ncbi:PREDICTED: neuronal cell adhesion molecule-like [Branchiostoma belcheri]|uniref:Neuronal cell adhesion molecule-like n=1 Tax=Branchiostoma belcheri TaxID=7741 RepID=A0A6P4YK79_BRABE|nr:PREDICTED: neuronal cell adhesion molecule-like [Branchiostoma belcheri]
MDWSIRQLLVVVICCFCSSVRSEEWSLTNLPPEINLDVPMPPVITKQAPRKHIVDHRELIVIDCEATGSPEIRYSWLKNGRELDVDSDPRIAWLSAPNSGTITIELDADNPDTTYEGMYQCRAANHRGTAVTNEIEVIIATSPLFAFTEDKEITVPVGAHHVLECLSILGEAIPPPNIYWAKANPGPRSRRIDLTERISIDAENNLIFANVEEADAGQYSCRVEYSKLGTIRIANTLTLIVETAPPRAPSLLKRDINVPPVNRGEDLTLRCIAEGLPTPEVRWRRTSGGNLPADRAKVMGTTLIIKEVVEGDAGSYECTASNYMGKDTKEVMVTVNAAPYWKTEPGGQMLAPGDDATILCEAAGTPTPEVSWKRNGEPLRDQPNRRVSGTTLSLLDLVKDDSGVYQCIARNNLGTRITNAYINVVELRPRMLTPANKKYAYVQDQDAQLDCLSFGSPKPTTSCKEQELAIERVQRRALRIISLGGRRSVPDLPTLKSRREDAAVRLLQRMLQENHPLHDLVPPSRSGEWQEMKIIDGRDTLTADLDLHPWSNYQFRVTARNKVGESKPSDATEEYETFASAPNAVPGGIKGEGTKPTNMVISWEPLPGLQQNGPGLRYEVRYRQKPQNRKRRPWTVETVNDPNGKEFIVEDTPTHTAYEITVQAKNDCGDGPLSDVVVGYSGIPSATVEVGDVQPRSVRLDWDPIDEEFFNGDLKGYKVRYWSDDDPDNVMEKTFEGDEPTALVDGLTPYKNYNFEVVPYNGKGEGPPSTPPVKASTPESTPGAPSALWATVWDSKTLNVQWEPPLQPNGVITGYLLTYRTLPEPGTLEGRLGPRMEIHVDDPTTTAAELSDLEEQTWYRIELQAKTSIGLGDMKELETYTSDPAPPLIPEVVEVLDTGEDFINVSWVPAKVGPRPTQFYVEYRERGTSSGPMWFQTDKVEPDPYSETLQKTIDGLQPGTRYQLRVVASNNFGRASTGVQETTTEGE